MNELALFPQTLVNVRVKPGFNWKENDAMQQEKQKVEKELGEKGRVLIRPSGTEPLIRVMVETENEKDARDMAERIASKCLAGVA